MEHEHETPELDQEFDPVFEEEQQHLTETYAKLQTMGRDLLAKMEANSKDAAADKLAMVDELSVNLASYADAMETYADFATVNRVIDAYNLAQTVDAEKLTSIQVLLKQPYFAKVVLQMKPGQEPKELYIGTAGIADENYRRLVVDWRSPLQWISLKSCWSNENVAHASSMRSNASSDAGACPPDRSGGMRPRRNSSHVRHSGLRSPRSGSTPSM